MNVPGKAIPTHDGLVRLPETYCLQLRDDLRVVLVWPERHLRHGVQDPEGLDGGRPGVGQQREGDLLARGELCQRGHRVVTDRRDTESFRAQLAEPTLEVHQLRLAVGTPVRRAVEQQQGAFRPHDGRARPHLAVLVREAEVRDRLADLRAQLRDVDLRPRRAGCRLRRERHGDQCAQADYSHEDAAPDRTQWIHSASKSNDQRPTTDAGITRQGPQIFPGLE